jgi:hypothetical protein
MEMKTITTHNLAEATPQQVFDQIATHLLTQKKKSTRKREASDQCVYHTKRGKMCAVGCLIPKEEYESEMEGWAWSDLVGIFDFSDAHVELIQGLQHIHDTSKVSDWENDLKDYAQTLELKWERP